MAAVPNNYGVTIDSPSLFYAGDRTLFWIRHPHVPGALNFRGPEPRGFETHFERHPASMIILHQLSGSHVKPGTSTSKSNSLPTLSPYWTQDQYTVLKFFVAKTLLCADA